MMIESIYHTRAHRHHSIFLGLTCGMTVMMVAFATPAYAVTATAPVPAPSVATTAPTAELEIVAVVNDEVITSMDVMDRVRFIIHAANLPNAQESVTRLLPQITRQLIDETLQRQEAQKYEIKVTDAEIHQALEELAARKNGSADMLFADLRRAGESEETLETQIRTQLLWSKVVARMIRPKVKVSNEEVEQARLQESLTSSGMHASEVQIVSLILPVDKPERDAEVKALAVKLVDDLRLGADFEDIATQLGSSAPQAQWVALGALDPGLGKALEKAVPGSVSNPARTQDGYLIVKLLNRRALASAQVNDSLLMVKDILLKLTETESEEGTKAALDIAREVARHPGDCSEPSVAGVDGVEESDMVVTFTQAHFSELAAAVQQMIQNVSVGGITEPFATDEGIRLLMLCERVDATPELADSDATYTKLLGSKLELETQKYMRNLRRDAFVEFRG